MSGFLLQLFLTISLILENKVLMYIKKIDSFIKKIDSFIGVYQI